MNALEPVRYDEVVRLLRDWPASERLRLIRDLVSTLRPEDVSNVEPRDTLSRARGFLKTDRPPPSDDEIRDWLDAARMEKYG